MVYDEIIAEAQKKAAELRKDLPPLPAENQVSPYEELMLKYDPVLIEKVQMHLETVGVGHAHGFEEHVVWVAKYGSYVADAECQLRTIVEKEKDSILQRTWRLALLHDLEWWRGYDKVHMIEGSKVAKQLLSELQIQDDYLPEMVLKHDELVVQPKGDPQFDVPFYSVFAVDHLNWGLEREEQKWREYADRGVDPKEAIPDYQYLYSLLQSPNLQQTHWGKHVVLPYIQYGIDISEYIEQTFFTGVY